MLLKEKIGVSIMLLAIAGSIYNGFPAYEERRPVLTPERASEGPKPSALVVGHPEPETLSQGHTGAKKRELSGWDKQTEQFAEIRSTRFGVAQNLKDFAVQHKMKAKKVIGQKELEAVVRETFRRLPHIRTTPGAVSLLVETAIVESMGGYYLIGYKKSGKESGDYGVFQIRINTAKDTLAWLKNDHKDVHESLMSMYNKKQTLKWNITHNVPFSTALAVTYYWRRDPHRLVHGVSTIECRANFWLDEYNTTYGAGTKEAYIKRVNSFKL